MAKAENTKPFTNKILSGRKDVIGEGFFKVIGHEEMGRVLQDVRSACFHPIDPVLACGLFHGGLVFLHGSSHATSFENWEIEPKKCPYDKAILSIQWNVDGSKIAAGSDEGAVIVWCYPGQGKQIFRRQGRSNFPLIVWNPFNRDVLASYNKGADSKHLLIGNLASEKPLTHTIISNLNFCNTVDWISHNQLACGYDDGTIEIHEMEYLPKKQLKFRMVQKIRHDLNDEERFISRAIFSPTREGFPTRNHADRKLSDVLSTSWNNEFNLLASSGSDKKVKIWSLNNNDPINVLKNFSDCECLVWNSSGYGNDPLEETTQKTLIACGLQRGSIVIWYPFKHENQSRKLEGHSFQIHQLLFSPDGRYLASTDMSKKLIIWSTKSWKSIYIIPSSEFMYPYTMTWDAASCKLGISERIGQKKFKMIEYILAERCCAGCKAAFDNLKLCARCHSIFYCSKECQCSDWPQHKLVCNKNE